MNPIKALVALFVRLKDMLLAPAETLRLARDLLQNGCLEVETEITTEQGPVAFRSILQIDADVITYMPNVYHYLQDPNMLEAVRAGHAQHTANLEKTIAKLSAKSNFLAKGFDGLLALMNFYLLLQLLTEFSTENGLYSGGTLALSLIFRKFLRPIISKKGMQLIFKLAKSHISKKFR